MKIRNWIIFLDLAWTLSALAIAVVLRYGGEIGPGREGDLRQYFLMGCVTGSVWILLYFKMSLDGFNGGWHLPTIISRLIVAVCLLMAFVLAFAFLTRHYYSRLVLFYFSSVFPLGLVGLRYVVHSLVTSESLSGSAPRCIILGNGPVARELARKIASHPEVKFEVVGFLNACEAEAFNQAGERIAGSLISLSTLQVLSLLKQNNISQIIVATPQPERPEFQRLIHACQEAAMQVYLVPQGYGLYLSEAELVDIDGLPLLSLREPKPSIVAVIAKRGFDFLFSLGMLAFVSPLLAVVAFFVALRNGKAFSSELRCGENGVPFKMYRLNVERHPVNPSPFERFLLRWSLTELPQLWNVLRGDMSLVGPRPESPDRVKYYSDWQHKRLKVPSGVTGLAQVHGLRDRNSSEEKTHFDLQYILNWSLFLDITLIVQTLWSLLTRGLETHGAAGQAFDLETNREEFRVQEIIDANRS
jgi:lipopolysaccharide/colanic/teichoic acid biosynthesis glycosyltransferase